MSVIVIFIIVIIIIIIINIIIIIIIFAGPRKIFYRRSCVRTRVYIHTCVCMCVCMHTHTSARGELIRYILRGARVLRSDVGVYYCPYRYNVAYKHEI
jgi:hypothetical protein